MATANVLSIVLAGGEGKRLMPLTADRAKPAVPFGGSYRLIDFVLSNLINSDLTRIAVLTQYKSHSLDRHISLTWRMSTMIGNYVAPVPAQQRRGPHWYQGSADAIYQSLNLIRDEKPDYVVVFGADNIYRMDIRQMLAAHIDSGLAATVAGLQVPREGASEFGVIDANESGVITSFLEKPVNPPAMPGKPDKSLVSMGNYIFTASALVDILYQDADAEKTKHDMGGDIVPAFVRDSQCGVYDFFDNVVPGATEQDHNYWRDVGTLEAFHEAHMDLVSVVPQFNLYNEKWKIYTDQAQMPGAKFTLGGNAESSIVTNGCIISGATVNHSVLSPGVRIDKGSMLDRCVVMNNVRVGQHCVLRGAIVDKNAIITDGAQVGVNHDADKARGCTISEGGIVVVPKGKVINP